MINKTPSVRTWYSDEIDNTTRAVLQSITSITKHVPGTGVQLYSQGYLDAINHLRVAVGLPLLTVDEENTLYRER